MADRSEPAVLEVQEITKVYSAATSGTTALSRLSLRIARGELVVITGVSGSGKTTLLNLLGLLDLPTAGRVLIDGIDTRLLDKDQLASLRGKRVGFVFQQHHLIQHMTALENVLLPFTIGACPVDVERGRAMLAAVGLDKHTLHRPADLSGGEQQRVAIARALVRNPDLVLADEPTGNLDQNTAAGVINLLTGFVHNESKRAMVIVTHQPALVSNNTRHLELVDGKLKQFCEASK